MRRKKARLERRLSYIDSLTAVPYLTQVSLAHSVLEAGLKTLLLPLSTTPTKRLLHYLHTSVLFSSEGISVQIFVNQFKNSLSFLQPQEAGNAKERKKEEWKMFKEVLKVHKAKKMSVVRAFETEKSKPKGILQHLNVARTQHQ